MAGFAADFVTAGDAKIMATAKRVRYAVSNLRRNALPFR
ncbi:hypothetical protein AC26_2784 [Escherichia coli 1-176-05_S3_C2]|nr:hypothetical protein AC26_2784 [Escherichia coli 1-176-05_S3_C2]